MFVIADNRMVIRRNNLGNVITSLLNAVCPCNVRL